MSEQNKSDSLSILIDILKKVIIFLAIYFVCSAYFFRFHTNTLIFVFSILSCILAGLFVIKWNYIYLVLIISLALINILIPILPSQKCSLNYKHEAIYNCDCAGLQKSFNKFDSKTECIGIRTKCYIGSKRIFDNKKNKMVENTKNIIDCNQL